MDVGGSRKGRRDHKGCAQMAVMRWAKLEFCWQYCWPNVDKRRWRDVISLTLLPTVDSMLVQRL